MRALNDIYGGDVMAINLIDTKGDQKMLGDAYRTAVDRAISKGAKVQYVPVARTCAYTCRTHTWMRVASCLAACRLVWFDFHKECRKMRYDRLSLLMDEVSAMQKKIGYAGCCA
jgi:hypothetical protein